MSADHPTAITAVFYARKSNEDDGDSISQQQTWAIEAAARENITIAAEFADQARAGYDTARRTSFHEMLRFCQKRHQEGQPIDAVLCWNSNRFSRADSQETAWFIWEFWKVGVGRMLTASRWIDFNRMEDRVLFNIEQDTSHHPYVINLARDCTRGRIAAAMEGRPNGGQVPYGYRVEYEIVNVRGKKKRRPIRLVVGPDAEVEIVQWLFRTYAAGELSLRGLAMELNRRGIPSPKGAPWWGQGTIKNMLNNQVYLGRMIWNREHQGKFFGVVDCKPEPSKKKQGCVANPQSEWISRENRHEPLIDRETWERCQVQLVENRKTRPSRNAIFALSGLLVCGNCGRPMIGRRYVKRDKRNGKTRTYRRYICNGYNTYGRSMCGLNSIDEDKLLNVIVEKLKNVSRDVLRQELERQVRSEHTTDDGRINALRQQLEVKEEEASRASRRILIEPNENLLPGMRAEAQCLTRELSQLRLELAEAERPQQKPEEDPAELIAEAEAVYADMRAAMVEADSGQVLAVVRQRVVKIELWFHHEEVKGERKCKFVRGLIWGRLQVGTELSTLPRKP